MLILPLHGYWKPGGFTRTLIIILLDLGIDRTLEGLVDGLGLEVLSATGAKAILGVHGSLERVTLPYPVVSRAVQVPTRALYILPSARGEGANLQPKT